MSEPKEKIEELIEATRKIHTKEPSKMGRPPIEIDWRMVDKYLQFQSTNEEIAAWIGCHHDTLCNRCKAEHGVTFSEYSKQKREGGKISLRRAQWQMAMKSPAMAIFLGKNYLGQSDKNEVKQEVKEVPAFEVVDFE